MRPEEFVDTLSRLSARDITRLAKSLRARRDLTDDLGWWQATVALECSLRRHHRVAASSAAARRACQAVLSAAGRAGVAPDSALALEVARAAGEVARALVAEDADADPCYFFRGWEGVLVLPAWTPCPQGVLAA